MAFTLIFRSLINFELIFAHGVRQGSNVILLHVGVQFIPLSPFKRLLACFVCVVFFPIFFVLVGPQFRTIKSIFSRSLEDNKYTC